MFGRLLEYGVSHLSSMRASIANTIWKSIKAWLPGRASPFRSSDGHTAEGHGLHSLERIRNYAIDGYTPFWMKKGVVEPWILVDRWETPPRSEVKEPPETEWFLWIARIVDKIEGAERMDDFKTEGTRHNPYRERILDDVCTQAFGPKSTRHKKGYSFRTGQSLPVCVLEALRAERIMQDP